MLPDQINYRQLDELYIALDKQHLRRTRNIRLIPGVENRRGGKTSYAEWAHVIGIFQTLMFVHLENRDNNRILDVGCGTGLLGIASEPFLGADGKYVGIDVMKNDIDFCNSHYPPGSFEFIHFDINNPAYAPNQEDRKQQWPLESSRFDLVTALSVWTHLNEEDALFYIREVGRVLKPGGRVIITFFILDDSYWKSLAARTAGPARYHMTSQERWIFDTPSYGSAAWLSPKWAKVPETAIGVTEEGLDRLVTAAGLELLEHYNGNWKEAPGVFFQDVLVLGKP